jgi:exosortase
MRKTVLLYLIVVALFVVSYFPAFQILVTKWLGSEEYSHAFLTLPILLFIAWRQRALLVDQPGRYNAAGLAVLLLASVFYVFSLLTQVHSLILASLFLAVVGTAIYLWGVGAVKHLFVPLLLFALLIPVPDQLYIQLTAPLQLKVSQISEVIVRLAGVPILREGNVMITPLKSFEVVEACSGMRSVITLLTLGILMGHFLLARGVSKIGLVAAGLPTAIFINIIRVVAAVLLFHFFEWDLTDGTPHTLLGVATFGIALVTLYLIYMALDLWEQKTQ